MIKETPYSEIGDSVLYNMDCIEGMKQYPDNYFDLAICDIPYGINVANMAYLKEVKNTVKQKNGCKLNANKNKTPYTQKDWDKSTPTQEYFDELKRVSLHQIIFGIEYTNWTGAGHGRIKWDKGFSEKVSFNKYETMYCSIIDTAMEVSLLWAGMCQAKSLSEPMIQQGNKHLNEKRIHPCHKPIMLYDWILKNFAKEGDKILDTHVGSGSSRVACQKSGYAFTGFEIDTEYCKLSTKKYKNFISQQRLF